MQGCGERSKKAVEELGELAVKISRLRKRLVGYGYSAGEVPGIIMEEFLKLQKIDWSALRYTSRFHQIKSTYRVDSPTAEMILVLDISVPNLHTSEVCDYLLSLLEYNSLSFGISLLESSSDSNDSGSGLQRRLLNHSKRRIRAAALQPKEKRAPSSIKQERGRKLIHKAEGEPKEEPKEGVAGGTDQFDRIFVSRPSSLCLDFSEHLEKELKEDIHSEDSQGPPEPR